LISRKNELRLNDHNLNDHLTGVFNFGIPIQPVLPLPLQLPPNRLTIFLSLQCFPGIPNCHLHLHLASNHNPIIIYYSKEKREELNKNFQISSRVRSISDNTIDGIITIDEQDGTTFPLDLGVSEMYLGETRMFTGIVRDITERKRFKTELAQAGRKTKLILKSAGEGIFGLDLDGNTTFVNPVAEKILGFKEEELLGQLQHGLTHHTKSDGSPLPA